MVKAAAVEDPRFRTGTQSRSRFARLARRNRDATYHKPRHGDGHSRLHDSAGHGFQCVRNTAPFGTDVAAALQFIDFVIQSGRAVVYPVYKGA